MNYLLKCLFLSCLLISVVACTDGINETVISAYQLPVLPEPSYKFSRNGESSVNVLECGFLKSPIDRIFSEYMNEARMRKILMLCLKLPHVLPAWERISLLTNIETGKP